MTSHFTDVETEPQSGTGAMAGGGPPSLSQGARMTVRPWFTPSEISENWFSWEKKRGRGLGVVKRCREVTLPSPHPRPPPSPAEPATKAPGPY